MDDKSFLTMMIGTLISADNNSDKFDRKSNIKNLKTIKDKLNSYKLTEDDKNYFYDRIEKSIFLLEKENKK